jgi:L-fucose isomerase-like protein
MNTGKVIFVGVARPAFDVETGRRLYTESVAAVEKMGYTVTHPEAPVIDPDEAARLAAGYRGAAADGLILQCATFVDGQFAARIAAELDLPILIWALPEPEIGGWLRLNSLTGANLASSVLVRLGRRFDYVYGLPNDVALAQKLGRWLVAAHTARRLRESVIAEIGNPPPGFYTSAVDALALMHKTGIRLRQIDLQAVFRKAAEVPAERYNQILEADRAVVKGLNQLKPDQVVKSVQFWLALRDTLVELKPAAVGIRCWPEFFTEYGSAACSTLSRLIEEGIPAACEADTLGAVTMLIQYYLTGQPTFLADLVHADRERNTCTFWHCGVGALSLVSDRTGPVAGVHPGRKFGLAFNNALKSGQVTVARLGQGSEGFRMLVLRGEALDTPNRFWGTGIEVRMEGPVQDVLDTVICKGFEHHFSLVWKDISAELLGLCSLLDIPIVTLQSQKE